MKNIIFFDLDDTLYSHRSESFPKSAIEGIKEAQRKGALAVLATGRNLALIEDLGTFEYFAFDYIIGANGALIMDGEFNTIYQNEIPKDLVKDLIACAVKNKHNLCFLTKESCILLKDADRSVHMGYDPMHITTPKKGDIKNDAVLQINLFCGDDELEKYKSFFDKLSFTKLPRFGFDIYAKPNTKASGIKYLTNYLNISSLATYSFGDGYNDMEMLKCCKYSVAMGNALPNVKSASTYITSDIDSSGIYNGLKHYNLI